MNDSDQTRATIRVCSFAAALITAAGLTASTETTAASTKQPLRVLVVEITSGPAPTAPGRDATFTFRASTAAVYTCSLDGKPALSCSSPTSVSGLKPGSHSFVVNATSLIDGLTALDRYAWTSGSAGIQGRPDTKITSGPKTLMTVPSATLGFRGVGGDRLQCSFDGSPFAACRSPLTVSGLTEGGHQFAARAMNPTGPDPAPAIWSWTYALHPPTPDTLPRIGTRRHQVTIHGGYGLTPAVLAKIAELPPVTSQKYDPDVQDDEDQPRLECGTVACDTPLDGETDLLRSPALTNPPFDVKPGSYDPNIAASRKALVVTSSRRVWFYRKSGAQITTDWNGSPLPTTMSELFRPLWDTAITPAGKVINAYLNLPPQSPCDVADPFPADSNTFCLNDWYDGRVIYDDFRDRFWIVAIGRNPRWKDPATTDPIQRASRRTKVALAVSRTDDPRDGFYLYWWNGVVDDGFCNATSDPASDDTPCGPANEYQPGDAGDYPALGIDEHYFQQTIGVAHADPFAADFPKTTSDAYRLINVFEADPLANGGCAQVCGWAYWKFNSPVDGATIDVGTQPVLQHGTEFEPYDFSYFVVTEEPDHLLVYGFSPDEAAIAPPLHAVDIPVSSFASGHDPAQPPTAAVPSPLLFRFANLYDSNLKAVLRYGKLYSTWQDCKQWPGESECSFSIRLSEINPSLALLFGPVVPTLPQFGYVLIPEIDRTFGLRNKYDDDPAEVIGYGNPAVEANTDGDIVVVYSRSGADQFPEARYTARVIGELDVRPSSVLHSGSSNVGTNGPADPAWCSCNLDTGGISVDPYDNVGIWMTHAYGYDAGKSTGLFAYAVGKVYGKPISDPLVEGAKLIGAMPLSPGESFKSTVHLINGGDGRAGPLTLRAFLVHSDGRRTLLTQQHRHGLPAGGTTLVRVSLRVPPTATPATYRLRLVVDPDGNPAEYSKDNNETDTTAFRVIG